MVSRLTAATLLAACLVSCGAGSNSATGSPSITASWTLDPAPPAAGRDTVTRVTLRDSAQAPILGAKLRLEGHMSHPGMTPVTTAVVEQGNGEYEARIRLSMAGDWILVLTGDLPGGSRITRQLDVVGVRPAE